MRMRGLTDHLGMHTVVDRMRGLLDCLGMQAIADRIGPDESISKVGKDPGRNTYSDAKNHFSPEDTPQSRKQRRGKCEFRSEKVASQKKIIHM